MSKRTFNLSLIAKYFLVAVCVALPLMAGNLKTASTQSGRERKFAVHTFTRMPLRVKEVRNLQKEEDWFRDLEIEIQNISKNPIYFISMTIEFPDIKLPAEVTREGNTGMRTEVGFRLTYGAQRLSDVREVAAPGDAYLKPGETYVFKMPTSRVQGLASMLRTYDLAPEATDKIYILFDTISLGDGTGYAGGQRVLFKKKG
jgi:hypothetical protein